MYSYKALLSVIRSLGFAEIAPSETIMSSYASEEDVSMKPEAYNIPLSAFRLTGNLEGDENSVEQPCLDPWSRVNFIVR